MDPVEDEVARLHGGGTEYLAPAKPEFKHRRGKDFEDEPVIKTGSVRKRGEG